MKANIKILFLGMLMAMSFLSFSQDDIKLNPDKVQKFTPYLAARHGGGDDFLKWKENNKMLYAKEMWYFTESWYVKRNYTGEGVVLNEEITDITRFEHLRKENEEVILTFPGFKDALVLLPANQLIYLAKY
jgi:hypothetical protein